MGIIELDPVNGSDFDSVKAQAAEFFESGASCIELGISRVNSAGELLNTPAEAEGKIITEAVEAVLSADASAVVAVYTSDPLVMAMAVSAGAQLIIDPYALKVPGALDTVARLKANVCLCFDPDYDFDGDEKIDVCGAISEFFYERIDACINAGIDRRHIMLDPSLDSIVDLEYRLKLQGRLKSFTGFALPLTCAVPKVFPSEDTFLSNNMSVSVALALFLEEQGFNIIRTRNVYDLALALDTWHSLKYSARPFRLRTAIGRTIKAIRRRRREKQ